MVDTKVSRLQLEIHNLEDQRHKAETKAQSAGTQYTLAAIGLLIGLILIVFTNIYWLGGLLFIAGALAIVTQGSKKRSAQRTIEAINQQIKDKRLDISRILEDQETLSL